MKDIGGFLTTVDQAFEFFKRCEAANATSYKDRLRILEQLQKEHRVFYQTAEQIKARLSGKKVMQVKHNPKKKG